MTRRTRRHPLRAGLVALAFAAGSTALADDKDLLRQGQSNPNVIIIMSNTYSMQYLPYVQGTTPNLPPDGQYQDSPISKFGLAKGAINSVVQLNAGLYNFGLSWYSYHQEIVTRKHWSYRMTSNDTISGAAYDFPGDTFALAIGSYAEWGSTGGGPIQSTSGSTETFGVPGGTLQGPFFGDVPAAGSCAADTCPGYGFTNLPKDIPNNRYLRVATHLVPVNGGQPYGQITVTAIKEYQEGKATGGVTVWSNLALTPNNNPGTVSVTYTAAAFTGVSDSFQSIYSTGPDNNLYMGFMKPGDWNLNSDCGGWFIQNSLPAVGIPRDYRNDLSCNITTCSVAPEQSRGCVLRYTRPQSAVVHYAPGATGTYTPLNPPDDNPSLCSSSVVHTGAGPEDQVVLMSANDAHIPEDKMFANADSYFSTADCFVNGVRTDDPNKSCRTGAIILLSDTFQACGPDCKQQATSKYLVSLKSHHVPVYVIAFGVPEGTPQATEAHCIATTSGAEDATHQGVFPVTSTDPVQVSAELANAFAAILTRINEATQDFASATVSSVQAGTGQTAYLATFNARKNRSIWDGALRAYKLQPDGAINPAAVAPNTHSQNPDGTDCVMTVRDPNDPANNVTLDVPCNQYPILQWNAQMNLAAVPLSATDPSGVADLPANSAMTRGATYKDTSNDLPSAGHDIPVFNFGGRRILWSLPATVAASSGLPATLPLNGSSAAATEPVPETTEPFLVSTTAGWWPKLKLLFTPQGSPPASGKQFGCPTPPCTVGDTAAGQFVRFIRGDRDSVIKQLRSGAGLAPYPAGDAHYYASPSGALKLGDIFHSNPQLIGEPENVFYYQTDLHSYQSFFNKHRHRRRVLYAGANDGLLHAFDVGVWGRTPSVCTGGAAECYDYGTGAELFAYAPRSIMQIFSPLTNAVGIQNKFDEWTVDGAPSAADVFIDARHNGTPSAINRAWRTVVVGTAREGSPFQGETPCPPPDDATPFQNSASSVYALDVTQPETSGTGGVENTGLWSSPACLDARPNCPSVWPTVLWEIQDATDADGNGYPDMGESWSKPGIGRICVAKDNAGNCTDERYVALFGGGFDRERKNRRGNWFYIVDIETGFVLYKVGSGTANFGSGAVSVNFASVPSEPSAIDLNNDGLLDFVYFGDLLGQVWRLDLRDLKIPSVASTGRWSSKLQKSDGTALSPMLLFQAPQPVGGSTKFYPIYYRPVPVYLGPAADGQAILGIGFGTGDRDDVTAICDPSTRSTTYNQRYYFIVDRANTQTVTEATAGLLQIASSTAPSVTTTPTAGWYLLLGTSNATLAERVITDSLSVSQYIYVLTQSPAAGSTGGSCPPPSTCKVTGGLVRKYTMYYANGNPPPARDANGKPLLDVNGLPIYVTDRGANVANASFATNPIHYISMDGSNNVTFTTNHGAPPPRDQYKDPTRSNIKDWKEN